MRNCAILRVHHTRHCFFPFQPLFPPQRRPSKLKRFSQSPATNRDLSGMAATRGSEGITKPRIFEKVEEAVKPAKKRSTKKTSTAKANTSKPRSKKTETGRVAKKTAAPKKDITKTKKEPIKVHRFAPTSLLIWANQLRVGCGSESRRCGYWQVWQEGERPLVTDALLTTALARVAAYLLEDCLLTKCSRRPLAHPRFTAPTAVSPRLLPRPRPSRAPAR